jgi:hypothetical protein
MPRRSTCGDSFEDETGFADSAWAQNSRFRGLFTAAAFRAGAFRVRHIRIANRKEGRPKKNTPSNEGVSQQKAARSLNVIRRHLDESQRAMVAARITNRKEGRPKKNSLNLDGNSDSLGTAAKKMNVSRATVAQAKTVLKEGGPGLAAAVVSGAMY